MVTTATATTTIPPPLLGPALSLYLGVWALLALVRSLTLRRGGWTWQWRGGPRGGTKLEFTGWALVLEWRLPGGLNRSRSSLLPVARGDSHGRRSKRRQHGLGEEEHEEQQQFLGNAGRGGDGPSLAVLLFWLGQAAIVLFLAWNALATVCDVAFATAQADAAGEHRRLSGPAAAAAAAGGARIHGTSRMRPMAFLLPSSSASSSGEEGTADWRYVFWAALLALGIHEYGHARAARLEGVPVQYAGVYLAVVLPGAFVYIPETVQDLNPWARLRVLVAGVAANARLCGLLAILFFLGLPARLLTVPDPEGGAVVRSLPADSPLRAALRPGDAWVALQDVPILEGATDLVSLLRSHAHVTQARSSALLRAVAADGALGREDEKELAQESAADGPFPLFALNKTVTRLLQEAELPRLEAAGLLPPQAFCTHLDLTEGEDEEREGEGAGGRPVPRCCTFDALVGRSRASLSVSPFTAAEDATSCFAYKPVGSPEGGNGAGWERLRLTCLPARELALQSHAVGLGPTASVAVRADRGRPFCFRPVAVPPNVLLKITLAHGRVVTFEGPVNDVANTQVAVGLADSKPRPWVMALLPERWTMTLDTMLLKGLAALMDVSFSLGALNLVPLYQLDGAHTLHEAVLLYVKPRTRSTHHSGGPPRLLRWHRAGVLVVGLLFAANVALACLAMLG